MKLIRALIVIIFLVFPLAQLTRIPLPLAVVNLYFQDLLVFFLVLGWLFYHWLTRKPFFWPSLSLPILVFFLVAAFSLLVNSFWLEPEELIVASLYLFRWLFYAGLYFVFSDILKTGKINLKKWLIFAGSTSAVLGLFQFFLYPNLRNLSYLGWDPHYLRAFGTFFDPGFLGIILVLTFILFIDYLVKVGGHEFFHPTSSSSILRSSHSTKSIEDRGLAVSVGMSKIVARRPLSAICYTLYAISYLLFAACYFALALTYSRSSYLAYLVGISVVAWIKKSPKLFLAAFLLGVLTILILPRPSGSEGVRLEREESAWARVDNWKQSLTIWVKHPVFGVGFNTYRYAQKKERFLEDDWQENHAGAGADSSLLFVLATTGLLGFLSYGFLGWQMLKLKSLVVKASLIALLIHSFFLNSLFYPWVMLWFWSLDALGENQGE